MTLRPARLRDFDERAPAREDTETAAFGLGCFWGPDARFGALDGVVRTRVGYAGGTKPDPTYHALGDHTEVVQVDYDPAVLSFTDLLDHVFRAHDPYNQPRRTQYQHVVFTGSPAQQDALDGYLVAAGLDRDAIETRIEERSRFYPAEDYHQKHSLRARPSLLTPFEEAGYDDTAIRESPAAAALNGHAAGEASGVSEALGLTDDGTAPYR
jgi:peptide-methionine (S)-S-oxide reductase